MDIDQRPNSHNDPRSECRSFGKCSQPRKISRGILIDSSAKSRPKNARMEALQTDEHPTPRNINPEEDANRVEAADATDTGKHQLSPLKETPPSLSARYFSQKIPTSDAVHGPTESKCNDSSLRCYDSQLIRSKDCNKEGIEKLSSATAREVVIEDKIKETEIRGNETLKMKLWEILETVTSPNKQHLNDYDLKMGAKDFESPQKNKGEHNLAVKSKQYSDTIESDSEFHNQTLTSPVTHSLSRKQVSNNLQANRNRNAQSTFFKDIERNNIPCFRVGFPSRISCEIPGGSLEKSKSRKQVSGSEASKSCSLDHGNKGEKQEMISPDKRSLPHGNGGFEEFNCKRKAESVEPKSVALQRDSHQSLLKMSDIWNVTGSSKLQENALKNPSNEKVDAMSPTSEMRTPSKKSSPGSLPTEIETPTESFSHDSPPKRQPSRTDDCTTAGMILDTKGIHCFKSWLASKSNCYQPNYQINFSDDAGEYENTPNGIPRPSMEDEHDDRMSKPSSEASDSETSMEDSHIKGCSKPELHFLKDDVKKSNYELHLNKKQRCLEGTKVAGCSPSFSARKGAEEFTKFQQHLKLGQEDGLTKEVAFFALALKSFKGKMNLLARKKSAEILMFAAERINFQLQNAKYQIQADEGEMTNQGKSKRKHLQMRYQELQAEFKAMHERFKEEVDQHLQHYRSTVEGLEALQMELKVAAEKKRASNRKLLLQAEAAIETELTDAHRRITIIQNSARAKLLQLKNIVAGCLRENIFS